MSTLTHTFQVFVKEGGNYYIDITHEDVAAAEELAEMQIKTKFSKTPIYHLTRYVESFI